MSIPTCSIEWRSQVADNQRASDEIYAANAGLEYSAYRDAVSVALNDLLSSPHPRLRTGPDRLTEWLRDGHYSALFESAGDPRGDTYRQSRRQTEANVLGIAASATPDVRPRYGYVRGSNESAPTLVSFGTVVVELDRTVIARANVLLGDSMTSTNEGENPTMAPEPLAAPRLDCRHSYSDIRAAPTLAAACDPASEYAELNIYGPLEPGHIVEVLFTEGTVAPRELRLSLDDLRIPFYEIEGAPP